MNELELIARQTENTYDWVNKFIQPIPYAKWETIPDVIATNVTWQTGHLIVSFYYHTVMVIVGHQPDLSQHIPLKEYSELFTEAPATRSLGKIQAEALHEQLKMMQEKSLNVIRSLSPTDLEQPLVPTPFRHPIATIKREALEWNIKHTMYHCGQLGLLKRVIDERYDFGFRRT